MKIEKRKKKNIVFSLCLALVMLSATNVNAQNDGNRGFFGRGQKTETSPSRGMMNVSGGSITNQTYGSDQDGFGITNQTYGQNEEAPLGSGLLMMTAAAMGYAAMKRNKKQTKK